MLFRSSAKFIADVLFPEPYVAPYVGITAARLSFKEHDKTNKLDTSEETDICYNYTVGLLIQLDWIDYQAAKEATLDYGLQNTFLDIYMTQYAKTGNEADPNTETDMLWGAGLRMEF